MTAQPEIVSTPQRFTQLVAELEGAARLSLDVESDSFYHYDERVCIVTLSTEDRDIIVDTLALGEVAAPDMQRLVGRQDRPLLMHSAGNDVLALKRDYELEFGLIRDTALAGTLLGFAQTGLATLVESYVGLRLPKELQRHDWGKRPLEPEHQAYLINDTRHLFKVHDLIEDQLRQAGILDEYRIECEFLAQSRPRERAFDPERFRRIKGHDALDPSRRGALKALYAWRDGVARGLNRAPFRVLSDHALLGLASNPPADAVELAQRGGVGAWLSNGHAQDLLAALRKGLSEPSPQRAPRTPHSSTDADAVHRPLSPRQRDVLGRIKVWREAEAKARGLGLQAVLPTPVFHELVHNPPNDAQQLAAVPRVGQSRAARYGDALLALLAPLHKHKRG